MVKTLWLINCQRETFKNKIMKKIELHRMELVEDHELRTVFGSGIISFFKKVVKWAKKHLVVTKDSVAVKGTHDVGGGSPK